VSKPLPPNDAFAAPWEGSPPRLLITTSGELHTWIGNCWNAQTLEAYSTTYRCTVWIPLPCKQWKCRFCANQKIKNLAIKCETAKPDRLLTLTVDPSKWDNPRAAFDGTRRHVPELIRYLRKRFGACEYLRVTELTKGGWPHYHLLVRSPFLPHAVVKEKWKELTGAIIVDLRPVKNHFRTYTYLVKYLSKMHKIGWTERHVSYSKGFFLDKPFKADSCLGLEEHKIIEQHPAKYLHAMFRNAEIVAIGYSVFAINPPHQAIEEATATPWVKTPPPEESPQPTTSSTRTPDQKSLPF